MPKYTVEMVNRYFEGNLKDSSRMQIEASNLIELLFKETNPIPIKETLNILKFKVGKPRLPLIECSKDFKKKLQKEIKKIYKEKD